MEWEAKKAYDGGRAAAIAKRSSDICPHDYGNLKLFCAWMGGWHDYNNGGE